MINSRPIEAKALISGAIYATGDLISQLVTGTDIGHLDRKRTMRSCLAGLLLHGPLLHFWYIGFEDLFESNGFTQWWSIFPKVAIDEMVWTPFWNAVYIAFTGMLKGKSPNECLADVKSTFMPLMQAGFNLWVPANFITYGVIPME